MAPVLQQDLGLTGVFLETHFYIFFRTNTGTKLGDLYTLLGPFAFPFQFVLQLFVS